MKDSMYAVIAVISVIIAVFCFYTYVREEDAASANTLYFVGGIVAVVITLISGAMFLSGRVNKSEDIHITE